MVYTKPQLSLWEKAALVLAILRTLTNALLVTFLAPFRGTSGSAKYINHVKLAILRAYVENTTVRHLQAISPTTEEAYTAFAKKEGFTPAHITCADGTKAFWIGDKEAEKVVLWFHGGGYNLPPEPGHLSFFQSVVDAAGGKVSILVPEYTLAPHALFPHQLREGIEVVRYVSTDLKRRPQDISIAGDSAGANLAIGIMSHMLHPHPEIPPLELDHPLAAKDLVVAQVGDIWSESFLGGKERDGYNEPLSAPEGWLEGLGGVVGEVLVLGGGDEVLIDCIRTLAKTLEGVHPNVTTVVAEGEWHDRPVVSLLGGGGEQSEAIKAFVKSRL